MRLRYARVRIAFRIRARMTIWLDGLAGRCDPLSPIAFMLDDDAYAWEDDEDDGVPGNPLFGFPREEGGYDWYLGED